LAYKIRFFTISLSALEDLAIVYDLGVIYFALAGRSDWDDGRWDWGESPRRDSVSSSRRHQPSPSPMFLGASPDARLVSPWLGGNTPHSSCMLFQI